MCYVYSLIDINWLVKKQSIGRRLVEERKNGEAAPSVGREGGMQVCGLMDCVDRKMCVSY